MIYAYDRTASSNSNCLRESHSLKLASPSVLLFVYVKSRAKSTDLHNAI